MSDIINNCEAIRRVAKWGIELASFEINYKPRTAIKSQALADFVADWTEAPSNTAVPEPEYWIMQFNGSKAIHGSGAGVELKSPTGEKLSYVLQIHFEATNNMAELMAMEQCLDFMERDNRQNVIVEADSELIIKS